MAFVHFCFIVPLLYPVEVVLSVSIGVGCYLCPNSSNAFLRTTPSSAFIKTAPISASAAGDMMCLRTLLIIKIAPFVIFFDVLWYFPCKRIHRPCFLLHFLRDMMHRCVCEESCQMNDTGFWIQGECCNSSKVLRLCLL
jgi:hypothetical protein